MYRTLLTAALLASLATPVVGQTHRIVTVESKYSKSHETTRTIVKVDGTLLLQAFNLSYHSLEHHVRRLGILHTYRRVTGMLSDKNDDDYMKWSSRFVVLEGPGVIAREAEGRGVGKVVELLNFPGGDYVFVIRGFELRYGVNTIGVDHHIDAIGVWEERGQLHVVLNDKNNDDWFSYRVQYAYVPRSRFTRTFATSGRAVNTDVKGTPLGTPVVCGFYFDYASKDHQFHTIAVNAKNANVQVEYHDANRDDAYRWNVKLAMLKDVQPQPTKSRPAPAKSKPLNLSRRPTRLRVRGDR